MANLIPILAITFLIVSMFAVGIYFYSTDKNEVRVCDSSQLKEGKVKCYSQSELIDMPKGTYGDGRDNS